MTFAIMAALVLGGAALELALHGAATRRTGASGNADPRWRRSYGAERARGVRLVEAAGIGVLGCCGGLALSWRSGVGLSVLAFALTGLLAAGASLAWYRIAPLDGVSRLPRP
jgi:hypothetical protein